MFCTECGASLNANSKSCKACGTLVELDSALDIKEETIASIESPKSSVSGELSPRKKVILISSVLTVVVIGFLILNAANTNSGLSLAEIDRYEKEHPNLNSQNSEPQSDNASETNDQNNHTFTLNGDISSIEQPVTFDGYLIGGGDQLEFTLKNNWLIVKKGDLEIKGQVSTKSFPDYNCIGNHPEPVLGYDNGENLVCQMLDSAVIQSATWTAPNNQPTAVQMVKNEVFYIDGWKKDLNPSVYKIVLRKPQ